MRSVDTIIIFQNSSFTNLRSNGEQTVDGLVINMEGGSLTIENCLFDDIITEGDGGAFYLFKDAANNDPSDLIISNSNFSNMNASYFGGVIYLENINMTVSGSYFSNLKFY